MRLIYYIWYLLPLLILSNLISVLKGMNAIRFILNEHGEMLRKLLAGSGTTTDPRTLSNALDGFHFPLNFLDDLRKLDELLHESAEARQDFVNFILNICNSLCHIFCAGKST